MDRVLVYLKILQQKIFTIKEIPIIFFVILTVVVVVEQCGAPEFFYFFQI